VVRVLRWGRARRGSTFCSGQCCFMSKLWWWRNGYKREYGDVSKALSTEWRKTFGGDEILSAEAPFVAVEGRRGLLTYAVSLKRV
jgi:hypothetical protein